MRLRDAVVRGHGAVWRWWCRQQIERWEHAWSLYAQAQLAALLNGDHEAAREFERNRSEAHDRWRTWRLRLEAAGGSA